MSPPTDRFNVAQVVYARDLDHLLTDPYYRAGWWRVFEYSYHRALEQSQAKPTTPVEWEVHHHPAWGDYPEQWVIQGTCRATFPS